MGYKETVHKWRSVAAGRGKTVRALVSFVCIENFKDLRKVDFHVDVIYGLSHTYTHINLYVHCEVQYAARIYKNNFDRIWHIWCFHHVQNIMNDDVTLIEKVKTQCPVFLDLMSIGKVILRRILRCGCVKGAIKIMVSFLCSRKCNHKRNIKNILFFVWGV